MAISAPRANTAFLRLLCAAVYELQDICECPVCDVFGKVPTEICTQIFSYLDAESLVSVAGVSQRWRGICQGETVFRRKIYSCLRSKLLRKARRLIKWRASFRRDQDYRSPTLRTRKYR